MSECLLSSFRPPHGIITDPFYGRNNSDPLVVGACEGCCEFVRGPVFEGADGRVCSVDKTICPSRIYSDEDVYSKCFVRTRELNSLKKKSGDA
jgi:hypothetical protein